MANKKKILINDDDLDQFIRIDLGRTFHEIKKEKYDNDFDLSKQFKIERDRSRNFRIYGKLSSTIVDCNNLTLEVYSDANYSDLYYTTQSSPYSFNADNIFRKKNGKYLIELNNYPFDYAYIRLVSDDFYYEDQLWEQKLVYYNVDGDFVSYGTNTFDFGTFGETALIIENDFSFFFNKHWIRLDLDVKEEKIRKISFSTTGDEIEEGQVFNMQIFLNEPSPFGNETCLLNLSSPAGSIPEVEVLLNGESIDFPYSMEWEEDEISKELQIIVNDDFEIELKEEFVFSLSEKFRLEDGIITVSKLYILDQTERGKVKFNIGDVYKNRLLFEGRKAGAINYSSPSVLRNGASWQGVNAEFFPCDDMVVKIRNTGINSVIPVNTVFNLDQEIVILAGEEKVFPVKIGYENFVPHKIKATYTPSSLSVDKEFIINGTKIPISNVISFNSYKSLFDGGQYDYLKNQGLEKDFKVTFDDNESSITFSSKDGGGFLTVEITKEGWSLETIQEYIPSSQSGIYFELYANTVNQKCYYEISFEKNGYRTMVVPPDYLETSEEGVNKYLVNVLGDVLAPYDQENEECFYLNRSIYHGGGLYGLGNVIPDASDILVVVNEEDSGGEGYAGTPMPLSEKVYTNHIALLSDNVLYGSRRNLTTYGRLNLYGEILESPFWGSNPVGIIPCTDEEIVSFPTKKVIDVRIPEASITGLEGHRGFDFTLNNNALYKIGRNDDLGDLHRDASTWWEDGIGVKVYNSENELFAGNPSMQEVLDVGDNEGNFGGLVDGEVIGDDKLRMRSKFLAQDFSITNIDQYRAAEDTEEESEDIEEEFINNTGGLNFATYTPAFGNVNDNFITSDEEELMLVESELSQAQLDALKTYITSQTIVPNLLVGDTNVGRNGLGGFAYQI
jgi:hypothetical protein|tara:strand:+ start:381 stop:3080 length:2700 start_codon:yes stop_codon:yes gene_type:complete